MMLEVGHYSGVAEVTDLVMPTRANHQVTSWLRAVRTRKYKPRTLATQALVLRQYSFYCIMHNWWNLQKPRGEYRADSNLFSQRHLQAPNGRHR